MLFCQCECQQYPKEVNIRLLELYIHKEKIELSINGFLDAKTELLPLLVIIDFPHGKLIKTMMF